MATRSSKSKVPIARKSAAKGTPHVIVDFVFDAGEFFISVENTGDAPALKVKTVFSEALHGVMGTTHVNTMALFRNIEFLAPRKAIRTFLDSSAAYFARGEPRRIGVRVTFESEAKRRYQTSIQHDLNIYADIVYAPRVRDAG
jgi:hypothetical protein